MLHKIIHQVSTCTRREYSRESIAIIGGGAAGLMATIFAQQNANVTLLERKEKCGRKIIMSGGSRCNVIPHESKWSTSDITNKFFTTNPEILKPILKTWSITDQYHFFQKDLNLPLSLEEETGKYFPESNDARDVLNSLLRKIDQNTKIITSANVTNIEKKDEKFIIQYNDRTLICDKVIMCSGGISVINSDGTGYMLLKKLGHNILPLYAALTPLLTTIQNKELHKELSGLSTESVIISVFVNEKCVFKSDPNALLFTHRGYSGPAVLNSSHTMINSNFKIPLNVKSISDFIINEHLPNCYIKINWTPNISKEQWEMKFKYSMSTQSLKNFIHKNSMPNFLPIRLINLIISDNLSDLKVKNLTQVQINQVIDMILNYRVEISGNAGLKKAEVTGGGVPLTEINPDTLESLICSNLYLTGEALDVFGCIGGFNFSWAWITGRLAGLAASGQINSKI